MMERQFEKAKRQKGRENIQVITRVITWSLIFNTRAAPLTEHCSCCGCLT
jgi:hypothetical protein